MFAPSVVWWIGYFQVTSPAHTELELDGMLMWEGLIGDWMCWWQFLIPKLLHSSTVPTNPEHFFKDKTQAHPGKWWKWAATACCLIWNIPEIHISHSPLAEARVQSDFAVRALLHHLLMTEWFFFFKSGLGVSDARVGFGGKYLSVPHFEAFHFGSDKLNYYNTPNAPCSHPLVLPMTSSCMKMEMWHALQDILLVHTCTRQWQINDHLHIIFLTKTSKYLISSNSC